MTYGVISADLRTVPFFHLEEADFLFRYFNLVCWEEIVLPPGA